MMCGCFAPLTTNRDVCFEYMYFAVPFISLDSYRQMLFGNVNYICIYVGKQIERQGERKI